MGSRHIGKPHHVPDTDLLQVRYPEQAWPLSLLAVLDAAALHLALNPDSAPAEIRPFLRVGYITMRSIAATLGIAVTTIPIRTTRWC